MEGMIDPSLTKEHMDRSLAEVNQAFVVIDTAWDQKLNQLRLELNGFTGNVEKAIGDTRSGVNLLSECDHQKEYTSNATPESTPRIHPRID